MFEFITKYFKKTKKEIVEKTIITPLINKIEESNMNQIIEEIITISSPIIDQLIEKEIPVIVNQYLPNNISGIIIPDIIDIFKKEKTIIFSKLIQAIIDVAKKDPVPIQDQIQV